MLPTIKHILFTTDLSDNTRQAFRYALSLAQQYQAQITLLHILEPLSTFGTALLEAYMPHDASDKLHAQTLDEVRKKLQKQLEIFCQEELHATAAESHLINEIIVLEGHPADAIIGQAKQRHVDMIVMGTHSHSLITKLFLGSISHKAAQISSIPLLIVPFHHDTR
ncbi:MAG: universal stress protein [Thiotrichaceae bacterium]